MIQARSPLVIGNQCQAGVLLDSPGLVQNRQARVLNPGMHREAREAPATDAVHDGNSDCPKKPK